MAIISLITGAASSGVRYTNPKPTASYNTTSKFNITNSDPIATYTSTGNAITMANNNSLVTVSGWGTSNVSNVTVKGLSPSPAVALSRAPFTYGTYYAPPPAAYGFPHFQACPGGGTVHNGQCMVFHGSPSTYKNPGPGGYSGGTNEWYRIA